MKSKREMVQYIIWGILSSLLNIGLFQGFLMFHVDYRVANAITLIVVKVFSYISNKIFVFKTPYKEGKFLLKEIFSFFIARGTTFLLDFAGVWLMVEVIKTDAFISKCVMAVIVICVNYILSKKFVFRKK